LASNRIESIRKRIRSGFYDSDEVLDRVAERALENLEEDGREDDGPDR
jgi:hypothetical protein